METSNLLEWTPPPHLVYKQNKMQHKQCDGDKCSMWKQAREAPCLLVPYLIQFTEVLERGLAPGERKVSSTGWKHAKHPSTGFGDFGMAGMEPAVFHSFTAVASFK